ncbi:hypothetical protein L202_04423 [Cryptococcus amylolentus CBS 6039]|uniref:Uncharacterized protein n=1 Tax=Cryptococcus amylolentus CBS 6039 TaxID=1295533 RepID=A0A1E3HRA0_9TREE|nr:hypothetical protein L202_04423 [Cryptococcus amylolentus CBS 6039]ODN78888.1 hypothetical protein L202_04423 [Cryptococcus amylolentus CBS 6039]
MLKEICGSPSCMTGVPVFLHYLPNSINKLRFLAVCLTPIPYLAIAPALIAPLGFLYGAVSAGWSKICSLRRPGSGLRWYFTGPLLLTLAWSAGETKGEVVGHSAFVSTLSSLYLSGSEGAFSLSWTVDGTYSILSTVSTWKSLITGPSGRLRCGVRQAQQLKRIFWEKRPLEGSMPAVCRFQIALDLQTPRYLQVRLQSRFADPASFFQLSFSLKGAVDGWKKKCTEACHDPPCFASTSYNLETLRQVHKGRVLSYLFMVRMITMVDLQCFSADLEFRVYFKPRVSRHFRTDHAS